VSGEGVRFVHTSTSEVYGSALYTPMPEAHPINPQSPYAASKVGADALVKAFVDSYRLDAVTLRPFNTFGPRQSERAVIPTIIRQSLDPKCESIQLGNLTTRRDLTYVGDTVNAFLAVGSLETPKGEVYNCGTGVSVSIENLARLICSMIENKPIVQATDRTRPIHSEVSDLVADIKKILPIWHSEVSLIEGLEKTNDWGRPRMDKIRKSPEYII